MQVSLEETEISGFEQEREILPYTGLTIVYRGIIEEGSRAWRKLSTCLRKMNHFELTCARIWNSQHRLLHLKITFFSHFSVINQIIFDVPLYNYTWLNLKLHGHQGLSAWRTPEGRQLGKTRDISQIIQWQIMVFYTVLCILSKEMQSSTVSRCLFLCVTCSYLHF